MASSIELLRSGDKNDELLQLYLTGEMYDCSFKVGSNDTRIKIFKCHKLILSMASTVFQRMFYGHFQESKKGPDDPVVLEYVHPTAFDATMRYIYGCKKEFYDASFAVEIYKFAHQMQIDNLVSDVGKFFYDVSPDKLIPVYNLFALTNNEKGLENCRIKISQNTEIVLDSIFWLAATEETMQDIIEIEDLTVSQSSLLKAIERWGKARIKAEKNHSCNDDELRAMVDSCLKRIRFMSMDAKEFAELSTSTKVLSIEEKYWILLAIVRNEPEYIPKNFNRGVSRRSRLSASAIICNTSYICCGTLANTALKFSVSHPVTLLGLEIDIDLSTRELRRVPIVFAPASSGFKFMGFTVSDARGVIVAVGNTSNRRKVEDRDIVLVSPPTVLQIGHQYAINFNLIPKPHYFFEIRNLNKSELLINSTKQPQSPRQGTVEPSFWNFPPPMQNFSMEPPSLLSLRLSSGREQTTQRQRKMPIISRAQRFRQENKVNFQIHERFSSAPIAGFIFDPLQ